MEDELKLGFSTSNDPFTADELRRIGFDFVDDMMIGFDVSIERTAAAPMAVLMIGKIVCPKVKNLLESSPLLYRTLGFQYEQLESISQGLERLNQIFKESEAPIDLAPLISSIDQMMAMVLDTRRCAEQGVDAVVSDWQAAEKHKLDMARKPR